MELVLKNNKGFKWFTGDNVWGKGYLFDEYGNLIENENLVNYFRVRDEEELKKKLYAANGSFCLVLMLEDRWYVAVDRVRSMQMFIAKYNDVFSIGDDARTIKSILQFSKLDNLGYEEIQQSGYTVGNRTAYVALSQLMGGQYAVLENGEYKINFYYKHDHINTADMNKKIAFDNLDVISKRIFSRLIESAHGKQIVVPLSGGYDSRYIVAWLKKLNYRNVCCFSYGKTDSFEVKISKQVAEKLGFSWYYVEYDRKTWENVFSEEWESFFSYSGQYCQCPHVQDIYAIKKLLGDGIIEHDAIIVPGYCGDGLGGSYLSEHVVKHRLSPVRLAENISDEHFYFSKKKNKNAIRNDILKEFSQDQIEDLFSYNNVREKWFTINRWSKFVVNALRGYDYFNLSWRMPLWDNELMDFWYKVPNKYRGENTWYDEYLLDGIFAELGIDIKKDKTKYHDTKWFYILRYGKNFLEPLVPGMLIRRMRSILFGSGVDINDFCDIYNILSTRIKSFDKIAEQRNPNAVISFWYLENYVK